MMTEGTDALDAFVGSVIIEVKGCEVGSDLVTIYTNKGRLNLSHEQDCCESVRIEEVVGDPNDLVGGTVAVAEERSNQDDGPDYESRTWTFYEVRTSRGDVTLRWLGESKGYYSESVTVKWEYGG